MAGAVVGAVFGLALVAGLGAAPAAARQLGPGTTPAAEPAGLGPDSLPAALSEADAQLYREIFAVQEQGRWKDADARIARLADRRLIGHVLAQRYLHPTAYRSRYSELKDWMARYADHPDAERIYQLALKRRPKNYKMPNRPVVHRSGLGVVVAEVEPYRSTKALSAAKRREAARLKSQIRRNVLRTRLSASEEVLDSRQARRLLDQIEIDDGYAEVAAAWFYFGDAERAYRLAALAAERSGAQVPLAHWIAGLAAWRLDRLEAAAHHFEGLALAERASSWNATAGAYWAARAHLRLRNPAEMSRWLALAARHPRTFYGLLAQTALGMTPRFAFHAHELDEALVARIQADPAGARALALLQIGERRTAERELRNVRDAADPQMTQALLGLAERARLSELAFRLGNRLAAMDRPEAVQGTLDVALYPIPPWRPANGFVIDRALVYALVRQESAFNPKATSRDGARGLMQLMPSTASFIARDRGFRRGKRRELYDPETNLDLGQRYLAYLLEHESVQGDLFRLVTAYNGGPGNLNKWQRRMDYGGDPLLFIESLPARETRLYIERVLANLWIYRLRLGQKTPSLDGIAAGDWPLYVPLDVETPEVASNAPN